MSCPTLCNPMDCSPPGFSVCVIPQAGVGCHSLLQRIFPPQGSNTGLLHCSKFFYRLTHQAIFFFSKYDIKWLSYNISQDKHQSTIQGNWICGVVGNNSSSSWCTFPGYWKFTQTKPMQVSFVKQKFTRKQDLSKNHRHITYRNACIKEPWSEKFLSVYCKVNKWVRREYSQKSVLALSLPDSGASVLSERGRIMCPLIDREREAQRGSITCPRSHC